MTASKCQVAGWPKHRHIHPHMLVCLHVWGWRSRLGNYIRNKCNDGLSSGLLRGRSWVISLWLANRIYLSRSTQRGAKTTERGKTSGQTSTVTLPPAVTALLTSEEENFFCRVELVAGLYKCPRKRETTKWIYGVYHHCRHGDCFASTKSAGWKERGGWIKRSAPHGKKTVIITCNCEELQYVSLCRPAVVHENCTVWIWSFYPRNLETCRHEPFHFIYVTTSLTGTDMKLSTVNKPVRRPGYSSLRS